MDVFLLGGTGFIGRHILQRLVEGGHDVIGLARSQASAERLKSAGATPLLGDLYSLGGGLPAPGLPDWDWRQAGELVPDAFTLAFLIALQSLLAATAKDGVSPSGAQWTVAAKPADKD